MVVQMRVDVGRGAEVAVPEPFLNLLHGNAFRQQQACATVAQVMKADMTQAVLCQDAAKASGQIGRADALAQLVEADVPFIGAAV